jgi:hypothetical protein
MEPGAISAPEICAVEAHPPMPHVSSVTTTRPTIRWKRIDLREPG